MRDVRTLRIGKMKEKYKSKKNLNRWRSGDNKTWEGRWEASRKIIILQLPLHSLYLQKIPLLKFINSYKIFHLIINFKIWFSNNN